MPPSLKYEGSLGDLSQSSPAPLRETAFRLIGSVAVDQPRHAEAIDDHAETGAPEGLRKRHHHPAVHGQLMKDALRLNNSLDVQRHRETLELFITIQRDVAAHEHLVAHLEAAVHDLVGPVSGNLIRERRPCVAKK